MGYVGRFWHKNKDGRVVCDLCPRLCQLHPGQRGFCFVRQNIDNEMILTTYGRSSGFCIDPIEKKPLYHFYPGTSVLSFGTAGCNLGCKFCQNWSISKSQKFDQLAEHATPESIANKAQELGCRSVAFTYNDPVIFAEYAIDVAKACRAKGIHTVAVTAGYITKEARGEFFEHMDAVNVDLKAFTERFYQKLTLSSLQPVLETLQYLVKHTHVWVELTNLIIPGENDHEGQLHAMAEWIVGYLGRNVPLHFTAFHPDYRMMNHESTPVSTLVKARSIAMSKGLKYVYTGNIDNVEGESSYCSRCHEVLIRRSRFRITDYNLVNGQCSQCQEMCAGYFENASGRWGSKRRQVDINS